MATSSVEAAKRVLRAVHEAIPNSALIHGADALIAGSPISDLDIAVGSLPDCWDRALVESLGEIGLTPFIVWLYDSSAVTLFLAAQALTDGVQLDLLHSPTGQGKYGFLTHVAVLGAIPGPFGPVLNQTDSWLYLLRKRAVKGHGERIKTLLSKPPAAKDELIARAGDLFAPGHRDVVRAVLTERVPVEPRVPFRSLPSRVVFRLRHPAGLWIHVDGDGAALEVEELHARLRRFVLRVDLVDGNSRHPAGLEMWRIHATRLRAGVVVSSDHQRGRADIRIRATGDTDEVCELIRRGASERAGQHLDLLRRGTSW